ncbi:MAG: hypothetical protein IPJ20_25150 [Flammeovirgaceae bacterium]|nr:hypothetical protein [Flammeovirgaceae bacterium]
MLKKVFFSIIFILTQLSLQAQDQKKHWIDSVFQTLNTQEKIGQLFMISADAYASAESLEELSDLVRSYRPGGIFITHGGPKSHANLINKLQQESFVPFLVGINAEWGLGQSLDSVMQFQKPLLMGAASADLAFETGKEIARQMSALGIHINFAPNADFDLPIADYSNALRYFSDQSLRASERAISFTKGLQIGGALACAKHLPTVTHTQQVLNKDTSQF